MEVLAFCDYQDLQNLFCIPTKMLELHCSGSPRQIGHTHGLDASSQVKGSIFFYSTLFQESCSMTWQEVKHEASKYISTLQQSCPRYLDEIEGVADGAGVDFLDVLALNVRTEIMFGLFIDPIKHHGKALDDIPSDGCTSLGLVDELGESFIAQNWDWQLAQEPNLVICHISQPGTSLPDISMVTEAGIIGKIGLNSAGVGCCLNAIRARGVDMTKLPVHFALRSVLDSWSREEAIERINAMGIAGSGHVLLGDGSGSAGLECTVAGIKEIAMKDNRIYHTNHLILDHPLI